MLKWPGNYTVHTHTHTTYIQIHTHNIHTHTHITVVAFQGQNLLQLNIPCTEMK